VTPPAEAGDSPAEAGDSEEYRVIKGFKEFILRGNVIDLAVAVVIGAAFTLIVTAIVNGLINPLIALVFNASSLNEVGWTVTNLAGDEVFFGFGMILGAVINFLAVALVVYFVFVYPMNTFKERAAARRGITEEEASDLPTEQELLVQIRDLLAAQPKA
jgi:large conductance mechanosensitive channel